MPLALLENGVSHAPLEHHLAQALHSAQLADPDILLLLDFSMLFEID